MKMRMVCLSCICILGGLFLVNRVIDSYIIHRARIPTCQFNRKQILELERRFREGNTRHQYTADLKQLRLPGDLNPAILSCPDGGEYRVTWNSKEIAVSCSLPDHKSVSLDNP
jgi:hypothetical protein